MDMNDLKKLDRKLRSFVAEFADCVKTRNSFRHLRTYIRGQLGPLPRKTVEPIALDAGVPVRTLQEFLHIHRFDEEAALSRLRQLMQRDHAGEDTIGLIDGTSFPKKGVRTPGVQRQWCGLLGKTENCVVTVHLGFMSGTFRALADGDLYVPECWCSDNERREKAKIPASVVFRKKWEIALDLLRRSLVDGLRLSWVVADEEFGQVANFRKGVAALGPDYVLEVPKSLAGWTHRPQVLAPGASTGRGRPRTQERIAPGEKPARPLSGLWSRGGPSWTAFRVKDTNMGALCWRVRETAFYPSEDGLPGERCRAFVARQVQTGEIKYFLSNAPEWVPLNKLLSVAFSRWGIERLFEDAKSEIGLDHFEMRQYPSLMRHLALSTMSLYFLADQTDRLRGEKPAVDLAAGEASGRECDRGQAAARPGSEVPFDEDSQDHHPIPTPHGRSAAQSLQETEARAAGVWLSSVKTPEVSDLGLAL